MSVSRLIYIINKQYSNSDRVFGAVSFATLNSGIMNLNVAKEKPPRNLLVGQDETWDGQKFDGKQFAEIIVVTHSFGSCKEGNPSVTDCHSFSHHRWSLADWADKVQRPTAKNAITLIKTGLNNDALDSFLALRTVPL